MNKERICLIFKFQNQIDYWISWFRNKYENYISSIYKTKKEIHLKNGTVLYFRTLEDNLRGLRFDKEFNGERLELLCLNYENKELKNKIDKTIKYLETNGYGYDCCGDMCYFLDEDNQKDLFEILKGDVDE